MRSNYRRIGDLIHLVDERNKGLNVSLLLGLTISKKFIPSVANTIGTDMENYKIIRKNQFACSLMQVRRDKRIPVALVQEFDEAIISQAYPIFEVNNTKEILPEYLMMWFSREEFDRESCFYAVGGVRGSLEWEDFCNMELPVPDDIIKQQEIVDEYNTIKDRIKLNNSLISKLEETAQALYREWFVDKIDVEDLPEGWKMDKIDEISTIKAGGDRPNMFSSKKTNECNVPIYSNGVINEGLYGFTNKANYPKNSITVSARGTIGYSVLRHEPFDAIVRLLVIMPKQEYFGIYLWQTIRKTDFDNSGSVQNQLTIPQISTLKILIPEQTILQNYDKILKGIYKNSYDKFKENENLGKMKDLILSKMASEG